MFDIARGIACRLQRPNIADHSTLVRWLEDPFLGTTVFDEANFMGDSQEQAKFWIEHNAEVYGASEIALIARRLRGNEPVGLLLLKSIDWRSRTADLHFLVGEEKYRNSIYGPEITLLGLLWAFNSLNFHKLYGYILASNKASQNLAGFGGVEEGILKNYFETEDGWNDYHLYSLTSEEFRTFLQDNKTGVLRRHFQNKIIVE